MENVIHSLLAETDKFAVKNVISGRGGPFGALIALFDRADNKYTRVGNISANAVLATGVASAHAEDQALQPANLQQLIVGLQDWKRAGREPTVIFASSGQSCQSCHAKEEIIARSLIGWNLVTPGNFVVAYGATFEDTAQIAGFNDLPYVIDLVRYDQDPQSKISMVKTETSARQDLSPAVASLFNSASRQISVIARGNEILSVGQDRRYVFDPISTSEVDAIQNACKTRHAARLNKPWVLGNENHLSLNRDSWATLYTNTSNVGPLMRGESQWAAVNRIVTVSNGSTNIVTQEGPTQTSNNDLLHSLAKGYNHDLSVLKVVRDEAFENLAQHEWARKLRREGNAILYNGLGSDSDLARFTSFANKAFSGMSLDAA